MEKCQSELGRRNYYQRCVESFAQNHDRAIRGLFFSSDYHRKAQKVIEQRLRFPGTRHNYDLGNSFPPPSQRAAKLCSLEVSGGFQVLENAFAGAQGVMNMNSLFAAILTAGNRFQNPRFAFRAKALDVPQLAGFGCGTSRALARKAK